jgi:hypothetical protein
VGTLLSGCPGRTEDSENPGAAVYLTKSTSVKQEHFGINRKVMSRMKLMTLIKETNTIGA